MEIGQEARRTAMKAEEAVLLPALPGHRIAGGAALQSALLAAADMGKKQVSDAVSARIAEKSETPAGQHPTYRRPGSRAALHQVLRRQR